MPQRQDLVQVGLSNSSACLLPADTCDFYAGVEALAGSQRQTRLKPRLHPAREVRRPELRVHLHCSRRRVLCQRLGRALAPARGCTSRWGQTLRVSWRRDAHRPQAQDPKGLPPRNRDTPPAGLPGQVTCATHRKTRCAAGRNRVYNGFRIGILLPGYERSTAPPA
jgi:hypothetical protein